MFTPYGKFYFYFKRVESRVKAKEITENLAVKEKKKACSFAGLECEVSVGV